MRKSDKERIRSPSRKTTKKVIFDWGRISGSHNDCNRWRRDDHQIHHFLNILSRIKPRKSEKRTFNHL